MFKKRVQKGSKKRAAPDAAPADATAAAPAHATIVKKDHKKARGQKFSNRAEESDDEDDEDRMQASAVFASSRTTDRIEHRGGAFEHGEVDTAEDRDQRSILERKLELERNGETGDGIYRGAAGYKSYTKQDEAKIGGNKYTGTKGPIRAPQFVRNTCRFDYQPDVCKDYKDTGFCGYGDSCKFMHDRGDYKTGWQLEAEFQRQKERQKEREMMGKLDGPDSDEERERDKFKIGKNDDDLPFACHLSRGPFEDPMLTACGHYFNANWISRHFREKNTRCPICEKQTYGMLNAAPKLRAKAKAVGGFQKLFELALAVPDDDDGGGAPTEEYAGYRGGEAYGAPVAQPGAQKPTERDHSATGFWQSVDPRNL